MNLDKRSSTIVGTHKALQEVCAASLPLESLGALADLRCLPGLNVVLAEGRAWLRWPAGEERILENILAVSGVELFVRRGGGWSRYGSLLPAEALPLDRAAQPLAHVLMPAPVTAMPPADAPLQAVQLRLAPSTCVRETTALRCRAVELLAWSERVPASRLAELQAVRSAEFVLLIGKRLPEIGGGERFWGQRLLVPLGWRLEPELPEPVAREMVGLAEHEILVVTQARSEVVAQHAFRPLTRASLRLLTATV